MNHPSPSPTPEEILIQAFNEFIKKWTGDNYPHLIDCDENDGERFREKISQALTTTRQEALAEFTCPSCGSNIAYCEDCRRKWINKGLEEAAKISDSVQNSLTAKRIARTIRAKIQEGEK